LTLTTNDTFERHYERFNMMLVLAIL